MRRRSPLTLLALACTLSLAGTFACKDETPAPRAATALEATTGAPTAAAPAAPVATGSIKGVVKLLGQPPEMKELNKAAESYCAKTPSKDEEVVVGKDGGLGNVVVRLSKVSGAYPPGAGEVVIQQMGCVYSPRVSAVQAGQTIVIKNGDQILHNVHAYLGPKSLFNKAQPANAPAIAQKLSSGGEAIKFKCDVHPWMTGWAIVTEHPFFAVTKSDGAFSLDKVPAGTYTLEAWHERFGTKTAAITVVADKPADAKLEFTAP